MDTFTTSRAESLVKNLNSISVKAGQIGYILGLSEDFKEYVSKNMKLLMGDSHADKDYLSDIITQIDTISSDLSMFLGDAIKESI